MGLLKSPSEKVSISNGCSLQKNISIVNWLEWIFQNFNFQSRLEDFKSMKNFFHYRFLHIFCVLAFRFHTKLTKTFYHTLMRLFVFLAFFLLKMSLKVLLSMFTNLLSSVSFAIINAKDYLHFICMLIVL